MNLNKRYDIPLLVKKCIPIHWVLRFSIFCLLLLPDICLAQLSKKQLLGDAREITVPFTYINGFIVVDVVFQRLLPLKFILDTGAENTILFKREYAELLRVQYHKRIRLLGADMQEEVFAYVCNNTYMQFFNSKTVIHNILVLEDDVIKFEEYVGTKIDGILGAEFFTGLAMKIDYKRNEITLIDPNHLNEKKYKHYYDFDLEIFNSKPYLNCTVQTRDGVPVKTKLLIDTGAALTALLHQNTDTLLKSEGRIIKGSLGKGLGGDIEGYSGKIHELRLGDIYFNNLICSFQELDSTLIIPDKFVRNGLLGNLLLERFDIIINFEGLKIYLKPNKNYNKAFDFDKTGMSVFAYGENLNQYYIKYVSENTPASDADIREGDIILKIGSFSYKWFSLWQVNRKFSGKSGKKVKLTLKRGNEILQKQITLRELFQTKV
jgi:predicted aspartyl protease